VYLKTKAKRVYPKVEGNIHNQQDSNRTLIGGAELSVVGSFKTLAVSETLILGTGGKDMGSVSTTRRRD